MTFIVSSGNRRMIIKKKGSFILVVLTIFFIQSIEQKNQTQLFRNGQCITGIRGYQQLRHHLIKHSADAGECHQSH